MRIERSRVSQREFELLADLRYALRRFSSFSESAARDVGLTPTQHQALLAVKGSISRTPISIGDLAERLCIRHHSAVGLVDRLIARGLMRRALDRTDRRRVRLVLSARGERVLERLSAAHRDELKRIGSQIRGLLARLQRER